MIYLQRYAGGVDNDTAELFESLGKSAKAFLNDELTSFERRRLNATIGQLDSLIDETFDAYNPQVQGALSELAEYEATFQYNALAAVMTPTLAAVPVERVEAFLTTEKMTLISGKTKKTLTLDEMYEEFREATKVKSAELIRNTIRTGVAKGDSIDAISRRVATAVGNEIGLPKATIRTWAKTNTLTAVNHISQQARNAVVNANSEFLEWDKWSSVLDGRTSFTCMDRDGRRYRIGEGPFPPAHMRCRSLRLPWIPDQYAIIKTSQRASVDGPVDSRTTYGGWLKNQSNEFQDDVLGVERAKLFRSGKVSIGKFTDDDGVLFTLDELKAREGLTLQ